MDKRRQNFGGSVEQLELDFTISSFLLELITLMTMPARKPAESIGKIA